MVELPLGTEKSYPEVATDTIHVGSAKPAHKQFLMPLHRWSLLGVVLVFGGIGSYLLFSSHADATVYSLYQLYKSGGRIYSQSATEKTNLVKQGWTYQRTYNFVYDVAPNQIAMHRMHYGTTTGHLVARPDQVASLKTQGWTDSGILFNAYNTSTGQAYGYCRQGWYHFWKGLDEVYSPLASDVSYYTSHGYSKNAGFVFYTDYACSTNPAPAYMSPTPGAVNAISSLQLDDSGTVIPDTAYTVGGCDVTAGACAHTVFMAPTDATPAGNDANTGRKSSPVATLNRAVALASDGDTIVIRAGTYRDSLVDGNGYPAPLTKSLTFQAYPHEKAWFDGTDIVNSWTPDGAGHWYVNWKTPQFCSGVAADNGATGYYQYAFTNQSGSSSNHPGSNVGPCANFDMYGDPANPAAGDPQLVYYDGGYMHEVTSLAAVSGTNFFYDWAAKRVYIATNPAGHKLEISARPDVMQVSADTVSVLGLGFTRYASNQFSNQTNSAIKLNGNSALIENNVFTRMAGGALGGSTSLNSHVHHNVFAYNGFNGISWNGSRTYNTNNDNVTIDDNVFNANNTELYGTHCSLSCSASNVKMAHMNGATIQHNVFENGKGRAGGFWCDIGCTGVRILNNVAQNNGGPGFFYEVSDAGIIASNLAINNGLISDDGVGIKVDSANTKIWNNTVVGNATHALEGMSIFDDERDPATRPDVGPSTRNVSVGNNIVESNSFTLSSQGPDTDTGLNKAPNTGADQFYAYLDYNAYFAPSAPALGLVNWRALGASNATIYKTLAGFTTAKPSLDAHSLITYTVPTHGLPFFSDATTGNYVVPSGNSAYHNGAALPADVATALGLTVTTGYSRGAISWPGN